MDMPTEKRWWCEKCQAYLLEAEVKTFEMPIEDVDRIILPHLMQGTPLLLSDPPGTVVRYHRKGTWTGGMKGYIGGSRYIEMNCGPVKEVVVSTEELFLEWLCRPAARDAR